MADYLVAAVVAVLAVVQGLAEFLPISSSGHVLVFAQLAERITLALPEPITVNVALHLGSLLAILVFYRRRILELLYGEWKTLGLLLIGTIPAGVVGVSYELWLSDWLTAQVGWDPLDSALTAGLMFFATGTILLLSARREGALACRDLTPLQAFLIGLAQAVAILPGLSRSGSTIAAALGVGMKREEAATFSFLLAIPTIAGAGLIEGRKLFTEPPSQAAMEPLLLGMGLTFLVSLLALGWLLQWLNKGRLGWFAPWVFTVGTFVLVGCAAGVLH